jgi:hypothetical protein
MREHIFSGDYATVYYHLPEAACRGKSTDLFFSQDAKEIRQAKRICRECPERERCLEMATANAESAGVWGGVLFRRGKPDASDLEYWRLREEKSDRAGRTDDKELAKKELTKNEKKPKKEKVDKNGRSHDEGFSRYPMPSRTVLSGEPKKKR